MSSRPPDRALPIGVAVAAALVAWLTAGPAMPPFLPIGDYATYGLPTPRAFVLLEPVMHAPWLGVAAAAPVIAAAVLVVLWQASRRLGAGVALTAVTAGAWIVRPDIGVPWASGAPASIAVALVWVCLLLLHPRAHHASASDESKPGARALLGVIALLAACVVWPPVVVLAPIAIALSRGAGVPVLLFAVVAAAAGAAGGLQVWAWRASALSGEAVSWRDAWMVATSAEPRGHDPFPWLPMAASTLPLGLALVGGLAVLAPARRTAWIVGVVLTALLAFSPHPWRVEASRAVYWAAWPLVAAGLAWVVAQAAPRWRAALTAGMALVLLGSGWAARVRLVETVEARTFAAALSAGLAPLTVPGAVMVTEDTRVDTAILSWDGGARLARVRPDPALVSAALSSGRRVLVGPSARSALELWGFRTGPGAAVRLPAPFEVAVVHDRLHCVPVTSTWQELDGLEPSGRLGVHLPRGTARLEVVAVDAAPLLVRARLADGRPVAQVTSETGTAPTGADSGARVDDGGIRAAGAVTARAEIAAHPDYEVDAALDLGARAPRVRARVTGGEAAATVCAAPLPRMDPLAGAPSADAPPTAAVPVDDDAHFAGGWHQSEGSAGDAFRWTSRRAVLLVPSLRAQPVTFTLTARAAAPDARLRPTLNGVALGERDVTGAAQDLSWAVPASLWRDGTNEIVLDVSRTVRPADHGGQDARELGVAVSAIRLTRAQP